MKKLFLVLLLALGSCSLRERVGFLDPDAIYPQPLGSVLDRHDAYVSADESLDAVERQVYLRSSAELRKTIEAAAQAKAAAEAE